MKDERKKRRKKRINPFLVLFLILIISIGLLIFSRSNVFQVKKFVIEGNAYYTDEEIRIMGGCEKGANLFWGINCAEIKSRLEQDTYMKNVSVHRSLPDTIKISVSERKQLGAIVYGEQYVVIDSSGIVLRKVSSAPRVTIIKGLTISKLSVGEKIEIEENLKYRQVLQLLTAAYKNDMYFTKVEVKKSKFRAYVLDNLYCDGTASNMIEAVQEGKVQQVVDELFDRNIERGKIQISGNKYISFTPKID